MNQDDVKVIEKHSLSAGFAPVDRYHLQHRRFDGSMSATLEREVMDRGPVVAVLPIDWSRRELVLVEQFRPGAFFARGARPTGELPDIAVTPWLIECIAGLVEPGESALEVARREAKEEAGCELGDIQFVARVLS
ncbi:MAG: NUDIX domain-containing protein, partial [Pseudomonadota bacterium]